MSSSGEGSSVLGSDNALKVEGKDTEYDNICGICFTPIHPVDNPRGRLNSCDHLFCSYCISKWSESTNVCPHCKALFTRIYTWDHEMKTEKCKKVRRRKFWNFGDPSDLLSSQEDEGEDSDTEWTEERLLRQGGQPTVQCDICHSDHNAARMIFCDRRECTFVAHLECLDLTEPPITFLCTTCTALRQQAAGELVAELRIASEDTVAPLPPKPSVAHNGAAEPSGAPVRAPARRPPSVRRATQPAPSRSVPPPPPVTRPQPALPALPSKPAPPPPPKVVVLDGPIDLAKSGLSFLSGIAPPASPATASSGDDDYYFMVPNAHALSSFSALRRRQDELADIHQKEREKRAQLVRRYQASFDATHPLSSASDPFSSKPFSAQGRKRTRQGDNSASQTEQVSQQLASMESALADPQSRARLEEQLARDWARDMVPILRRNRSIESNRLRLDSDMNIIVAAPKTSQDYEREDRELWEQAMRSARAMAQQKLDARATAIRQKRQDLVRAQAQREAAALAKLARIIALHRQRDAVPSISKPI